ncbi:Nop14-like family-domain-containing protein [Amanita rubescens]|nr:Nop14-like family-domain-containing protein [Amanita rubescens]
MAGIEQKKTSLKEYEERDHAGGILVRRFGENDSTTSLEERMLERFTRERQRAAKSSPFNSEDEDELTHYEEDEEDENGQIDKKIVRKTYLEMKKKTRRYVVYSGGSYWILTALQPARKKTKAEVMTEAIATSKEREVLSSSLGLLKNVIVKGIVIDVGFERMSA